MSSPSVGPQMHIAVVVPVFPEPTQTFIVNLVRAVHGAGGDVDVVAALHGTAEPDLLGIGVHAAPSRSARGRLAVALAGALGRAMVRRPLPLLRFVAHQLRHRRPGMVGRLFVGAHLASTDHDIVHVQFADLAAALGPITDLIGDASLVVSGRGADIGYVGVDEPGFYRTVWHEADAFHAVSHAILARAAARGLPSDLRTAVIHSGIDTDRFTPADRPRRDPAGPLEVVSIGRLHWKKGYEWGLAAIRDLAESGIDVRYRIIGDGPFVAAIRRCIDDFDLADRVTLVGHLPPDDVIAELHRSDVLLHSAVQEGFANVCSEAQACGVPLVAFDAEGVRENVSAGETAFVVPRRDVGAKADALRRRGAVPASAATVGAAGRTRLETRSLPAHGEEWLAFYDSLSGTSSTAAYEEGHET